MEIRIGIKVGELSLYNTFRTLSIITYMYFKVGEINAFLTLFYNFINFPKIIINDWGKVKSGTLILLLLCPEKVYNVWLSLLGSPLLYVVIGCLFGVSCWQIYGNCSTQTSLLFTNTHLIWIIDFSAIILNIFSHYFL